MFTPNRALLLAPVARDLRTEFSNIMVAKIDDATNGVLQAWDTLDQNFWTSLADPQIEIYRTLAEIRANRPALLRFIIKVIRYDNNLCVLNPFVKTLKDCGAGDWFKTSNGPRRLSTVTAADRPLEWSLIHSWFGEPTEISQFRKVYGDVGLSSLGSG